jgi:hypothetical protein
MGMGPISLLLVRSGNLPEWTVHPLLSHLVAHLGFVDPNVPTQLVRGNGLTACRKYRLSVLGHEFDNTLDKLFLFFIFYIRIQIKVTFGNYLELADVKNKKIKGDVKSDLGPLLTQHRGPRTEEVVRSSGRR